MDIRKLSIGADYKSGAMHYIVGQDVLGGSHKIHLIQGDIFLIRYGFKEGKKYICGKSFCLLYLYL